MAQPPAFVPDLRSPYLAGHRCPGNRFDSSFFAGKQGTHSARLCPLLVTIDHENHLLAHAGDWAGKDRHFEALRLCRESCFRAGHSGAVRIPALPVSHRLQKGVVGLPDCGLASQTVGAGLYGSAESGEVDWQHSRAAEKFEEWTAAGDLPGG